MGPATRFAPSPTGLLHRGHAFSALSAYQRAKELGARFVLRIEDIDQTRCRPAYSEVLLDDLAWLGLSWETPVRRQSEHLEDYHAAIERRDYLDGEIQSLTDRLFSGDREALIGMMGPGAAIGQSPAFGGGPRLVTAVSVLAPCLSSKAARHDLLVDH